MQECVMNWDVSIMVMLELPTAVYALYAIFDIIFTH